MNERERYSDNQRHPGEPEEAFPGVDAGGIREEAQRLLAVSRSAIRRVISGDSEGY